MVALTRQLAVEGAKHRIRAVSISPGLVVTPGTAPFLNNPATRAALVDGIPLARPGEADEVVATALFVASDDASYITGTDIAVDGGMLAV